MAWYVGGSTFEGGRDEWGALPDDGVLAVKVCFNDGTARVCSGNDWYGLLQTSSDSFTIIHNNNEDNEKRYPNAVFKRGKWTSEEEMQAVNDALSA